DIGTQVIRKEPGSAIAHELRGVAHARLAANALGSRADSLHAAAEGDLERAVQLDGSRAGAWNALSVLRQMSADFERAALYANQALDADEFMLERQEIVHRLVRIDTDRARFPQAASQCRNGRQEYPDNPRFVECHLFLAILDPANLISTDSATSLFRTLREMSQPQTAWNYVSVFRETLRGRIWARNGRPDSALAILDRMRAIVQADTLMTIPFHFDAGHVLLVAGDTAGAIREIQKYADENPRFLKYIKEGVTFKSIAQRIHD
ncbi:MAG: tetratricopeptide repeat protein, partial [Longimicrobiales bacterium]